MERKSSYPVREHFISTAQQARWVEHIQRSLIRWSSLATRQRQKRAQSFLSAHLFRSAAPLVLESSLEGGRTFAQIHLTPGFMHPPPETEVR